MNTSSAAPLPRSAFVTSLAWTFIVLGALATACTLLPFLVLGVLLPADELRVLAREVGAALPAPAAVAFVFANLRLLFGLMLAVSIVTLAAAIGLLRRAEWARLVFVVILALGVLANVAGAALPLFMSAPVPAGVPAEMREAAAAMVKIMAGVSLAVGIVFAALFAWAAKRLTADDVRREFGAR